MPEIAERLRQAAKTSGVGAVPPVEAYLPRLSDRTLRVLGWTKEQERFGNMAVTGILGMITDQAAAARFRSTLEEGDIRKIRNLSLEITTLPGLFLVREGFLETVDDYLDIFRSGITGLSPRSEGGIY